MAAPVVAASAADAVNVASLVTAASEDQANEARVSEFHPITAAAAHDPDLTLERAGDNLLLSAQFTFRLPDVVQNALYKGIPIYFLVDASLMRERWYWFKKNVASVQRRMRLAYHPLTNHWRLDIGAGAQEPSTQGLMLGQRFDSLEAAMAVVRRISRWKIAEMQSIEPDGKYVVEFSFQLDASQLPRPLQIGTLGQSDWMIDIRLSRPLLLEQLQ